MKTVAVPAEPTLPFIRMNRYHVVRFSLESSELKMLYQRYFLKIYKDDFDGGRFKENAFIIDVNCWKFPIRDVVNLGFSRDFWDIFWRQKLVKVQYLYDTPIQMTFEQAREEIVELICSRRWFSKTQDRESEKQFRERMAMCENMRDLIMGKPVDPALKKRYHWIGGISVYGDWDG